MTLKPSGSFDQSGRAQSCRGTLARHCMPMIRSSCRNCVHLRSRRIAAASVAEVAALEVADRSKVVAEQTDS